MQVGGRAQVLLSPHRPGGRTLSANERGIGLGVAMPIGQWVNVKINWEPNSDGDVEADKIVWTLGIVFGDVV